MIIIGGNEEDKRLGLILRIVATIIFLPIWFIMMDRCGRSDLERIEEKFNAEAKYYKIDTPAFNMVIKTDSSVIETWELGSAYEYVPKNKYQLENTLNKLQKRLERDQKRTLKKWERRRKRNN